MVIVLASPRAICSFRPLLQASRRAASSFFFELLALGTRDCLKLSQSAPYENIEVRAKDKLFHRGMGATQRQGSRASRASSVMSGL
jgi:cohesin complex subunit SCC1